MNEKNRQKMITAMKMMKEVCTECKSCLDCPFEYCDLCNEPMFWKSEEK
jgi:hypothetical protein